MLHLMQMSSPLSWLQDKQIVLVQFSGGAAQFWRRLTLQARENTWDIRCLDSDSLPDKYLVAYLKWHNFSGSEKSEKDLSHCRQDDKLCWFKLICVTLLWYKAAVLTQTDPLLSWQKLLRFFQSLFYVICCILECLKRAEKGKVSLLTFWGFPEWRRPQLSS